MDALAERQRFHYEDSDVQNDGRVLQCTTMGILVMLFRGERK